MPVPLRVCVWAQAAAAARCARTQRPAAGGQLRPGECDRAAPARRSPPWGGTRRVPSRPAPPRSARAGTRCGLLFPLVSAVPPVSNRLAPGRLGGQARPLRALWAPCADAGPTVERPLFAPRSPRRLCSSRYPLCQRNGLSSSLSCTVRSLCLKFREQLKVPISAWFLCVLNLYSFPPSPGRATFHGKPSLPPQPFVTKAKALSAHPTSV